MTAERTAIVADLFASKGYSATSTREISDALGVTKGTLYHHFPTKEDLLVQICEESLARISAAALTVLDGQSASPDRLAALIRQHVMTMLADQALHKTMLTELRSLSSINHDRIVALRDSYAKVLLNEIEACQAGGSIDASTDSHLLMLLLLNMLNWTIFWYRADGDHSPGQIAEATVRIFLDGCQHRDAATDP